MSSFDEHADPNPNQEYTAASEPKQTCRSQPVHLKPKQHSQKNPFLIPFLLILIFAVVELYAGIWSQSLALLSDAWHMFSDVFAIGLAMLAFHVTRSAVVHHHSHGTNKAELFASVVNALLMFVVIGWIISEAMQRMSAPTNVHSGYVIVVATLGLFVNLYVARHLHLHGAAHAGDHNHAHHHLNQQAAFLHVMGDILGSVAALVSGVVIYFSGWIFIDPLLSLLIAGLLLVSTINLCRKIYQAFSQR